MDLADHSASSRTTGGGSSPSPRSSEVVSTAPSKQRAEVFEERAVERDGRPHVRCRCSAGTNRVLDRDLRRERTHTPVLRDAVRRSGLEISVDEAEPRICRTFRRSRLPHGDGRGADTARRGGSRTPMHRRSSTRWRLNKSGSSSRTSAQVNRDADEVAATLNSLPADSPERDALQTHTRRCSKPRSSAKTQPRDHLDGLVARPPSAPRRHTAVRDATLEVPGRDRGRRGDVRRSSAAVGPPASRRDRRTSRTPARPAGPRHHSLRLLGRCERGRGVPPAPHVCHRRLRRSAAVLDRRREPRPPTREVVHVVEPRAVVGGPGAGRAPRGRRPAATGVARAARCGAGAGP